MQLFEYQNLAQYRDSTTADSAAALGGRDSQTAVVYTTVFTCCVLNIAAWQFGLFKNVTFQTALGSVFDRS